jgi:hypothetical protein
MVRETWSAPARRKIAPGQADMLTGCAICKVLHKELPESRYTQQRHSKRSATGLPRAGEVLPTTRRLAYVG